MNDLTELFESLADEFENDSEDMGEFSSPNAALSKMALKAFEDRLGYPLPFTLEDMEKQAENDYGSYYESPVLVDENTFLGHLFSGTRLGLEVRRGKEILFAFRLINKLGVNDVARFKIGAKGTVTKSGFRL